MAKGYASELVGVRDGSKSPESKSDGRVQGAKVRRSRATLVAAASTVAAASGDTNVLFTLPKGHAFMGIEVQSDVSLGTATLMFGTSVDPDKFATAKAYGTSAEAKVHFGLVAAKAATPSDEDQEIIVTIGTAALAGGATVILDLEYSGR